MMVARPQQQQLLRQLPSYEMSRTRLMYRESSLPPQHPLRVSMTWSVTYHFVDMQHSCKAPRWVNSHGFVLVCQLERSVAGR